MNAKFQNKSLIIFSFAFLLMALVGCGGVAQPNQGPDISVEIDPDLPTKVPVPTAAPADETNQIAVESSPANSQAYPEPSDTEASDPGYPGPVQDLGQAELPDPERNIEITDQQSGSVGGVLVHELDSGGYQTIQPGDIFLAEMILDSNGQAMFVGKTDSSPSANLFDTGVFVFQNVVPNSYALIVDMGFSQFPINDENGTIRLIEVKAGEALDLGQVFIDLP